jgi:hypothetical protein
MSAAVDNASDGGSSVPDIIGSVAKVADTGVMKDLLGRTFKAVGDYYGEQVEEFFNQRREQRRKNVRDHELQVAQVIGEPVNILSKPERAGAIARWVETAADVPLEDTERAALFEAVLAQILSTHGSSDFQDVAERLSSSVMRVLLNAPYEGIAPEGGDRQSFERLRSLGLARALDMGQAVAVIIAWLFGTVAGFFILFDTIPKYLPRALAVEFVVEAVIISAVILALGLALLSTKYRLTEFGRLLQQSALRFYPNQSRLRKIKILNAVPSNPLIWGALAAIIVCAVPAALEFYLPAQLRTNARPTVVITSAPANPSQPITPPPPAGPAVTPTPPGQTTLSTNEIEALIDFWKSIKDQMDGIIGLTDEGQSLVKTWPHDIKNDRNSVASRLFGMRESINQRRSSLQALNNLYQRYPNVDPVLREAAVDGVFSKLYFALDAFARETQALPAPPENFEGRFKPYAIGLKNALDAMEKWANSTRDFAKVQSDELSKVDIK